MTRSIDDLAADVLAESRFVSIVALDMLVARAKQAKKERDTETVRADLNENHAFALQDAIEKAEARCATLEAALRLIDRHENYNRRGDTRVRQIVRAALEEART